MVNFPKVLSYPLAISLCFFISSCDTGENSLSQAQNEENISTLSIADVSSSQNLPVNAILSINDQQIELEVAQTPEQQQLGLMFRTDLPADRGMLFPFEPPMIVNFWMKNVFISLDMLFIRDGVVQNIAHNVPPCTKEPCPLYNSEVEIDQVIELAGGRAKELNIQKGDRISVEFLSSENSVQK
ncbi:DUF192 domain-containing protein [Cyanobacterium sp. Dongsha4]|uniref:DUF192 domain-containing protein n=1 Tax=Cyanobacterium sp. DS4 TaxID=2878255 RepID=UPI002E8167F0|nr:DUF192 domain-containing protein [Cyanobacterium sp. Dongsha4]WVK99620.1 DUF192 domain-containing protein [Cyanobacterium sp. Dongsha4]